MIVSWNWLKDYVPLAVTPDELVQRLMMAGLNLESTEALGSDVLIDLEVTSNRPDCLGHIGIAREAAVLCGLPLTVAEPGVGAASPASGRIADDLRSYTSVTVECPELCPRYTARLVRGVKIKPSPSQMAVRLATIGQPVINNVVDITNYVMLECGQPLHAFDFHKLAGRKIIVRRAKPGEPFEAIDHKTYTLDSEMCVIADAQRPVALGGVMGGADTEISPATTDVLIEAAQFAPLSIRATARKLKLHSPSSYRFERGTDPEWLDWASRRACELILKHAGGELVEGVIDVGQPRAAREPIVLRLSQLKRILGIDVPAESVRKILAALGCQEKSHEPAQVITVPPSWRRDLTREIDLIEEVARIHGYDKIPEDASVPMVASHRTDADRVLAKVRQVLTAGGFDEAMTASVVPAKWSAAFSPWTSAEPLVANSPMLEGADHLRRSLVPSLLDVRRINESLSNPVIELFETARIYLPQAAGSLIEQWTLAAVSGQGFLHLKGLVEALLAALHIERGLELADFSHELLVGGRACELRLDGQRLGFLGDIGPSSLKAFSLRGPAAIVELDLDALVASRSQLVTTYAEQSPFPTIARDINLIVAEAVRWADVAATARSAAGKDLERLEYLDTYRDPQKDGPGTKRLLFSLTLRPKDRTLTGPEADAVRDAVVAACIATHGAKLLT
ncbi:MAG: phenylalanine--tRNA ligase subunit beta [Planctomycetaceae bacterium]|nr:phenylalanine--tRNA ligase subunit beta [Planctomycetaceae bacterium]